MSVKRKKDTKKKEIRNWYHITLGISNAMVQPKIIDLNSGKLKGRAVHV